MAAPNKMPFGELGKPAKPTMRKAVAPELPATSTTDDDVRGSGLTPGTARVDGMGRPKGAAKGTGKPKPKGGRK